MEQFLPLISRTGRLLYRLKLYLKQSTVFSLIRFVIFEALLLYLAGIDAEKASRKSLKKPLLVSFLINFHRKSTTLQEKEGTLDIVPPSYVEDTPISGKTK